jgi:hypothetical protein
MTKKLDVGGFLKSKLCLTTVYFLVRCVMGKKNQEIEFRTQEQCRALFEFLRGLRRVANPTKCLWL